MRDSVLIALLAWALGSTGAGDASCADGTGVEGQRILLGQSAALEGPAAELGRGVNAGLRAAFEEANAAGGIHGRKLELIALDDGYEPTRAIENVQQLIAQDGVFALIGSVGTPTSRAVVPIAEAASVPFIAPFTGATFLRDPAWRTVVNIRAGYNEEAEAAVQYLVMTLGLRRIAVLYQDDTFGRDGLQAVNLALARRGLELAGDATFKRNTTAVKRAVLDLRALEPDAVFIVGPYHPAAEFIRVSQSIGFRPRFAALSFVGGLALAEEMGAQGEGVLITQVVPPYWDLSLELSREFEEALRRYAANERPGFVSLEGYIAGRLVVEVLQGLGEAPTRTAFLDQLRSGVAHGPDGYPLRFSAGENQGSSAVFLTLIDAQGQLVPMEP